MDVRLSLFSVFFALAACGDAQREDIKDAYANSVRRIGLTPLYPPREDVQVGDIYLVSVPKLQAGKVNNPNDSVRRFIGHDPEVLRLAEQHLASRVVFERSNTHDKKLKDGETQADLYSGDYDASRRFKVLRTRGEKDIRTLPIVAFPSVEADAGTTASLGIVRVLNAFGLAGGARTNVKLDFEDVRKYGFDGLQDYDTLKSRALDAYNDVTDSEGGVVEAFTTEVEKEIARRRLTEKGGLSIEPEMKKRCYTVHLITEVFLTRQISYTYSNARIIAAALRVAEEEASVVGAAGATPAPPTTIIQLNTPDNGEAPSVIVGNDQLTTLQTNVVNAIQSENVGNGLNFQNWNALGVTFYQTFERPVAIAYNSIQVTPIDAPREGGMDLRPPQTLDEVEEIVEARDGLNICKEFGE